MENAKVEIAVFTKTQADLAKYEEDFKVVPDASTKDGYAFVKSACSVLTKARTTVESARKKEKQPYIDAGKQIDADAKAITARIVALEEPMKAAKKIQDDKEAIAKAERIAKLQEEVNKIARYIDRAKGKSSAEILEITEAVRSIDTSIGYYDLTAEAVQCQAETLDTLGEMYAAQFSFEDQEAQRIKAEQENARLMKAQQISERINNLKQIPLSMFGKTSVEIQSKIESLEGFTPSVEEFEDRLAEVINDQAAAIQQLKQMKQSAEAMELMQAEKDAEAEAKKVANQKNELEWSKQISTPDHVVVDFAEGTNPVLDVIEAKRSGFMEKAMAVDISVEPNVNDALYPPVAEPAEQSTEQKVIELVESRAYEWGIESREVDKLKVELIALFN